MDFLKKLREKIGLSTTKLGKATNIPQPSISKFENDREPLGEQRAKVIGGILGIPEDVMTIYRGHLPSYAKKAYREKPDKLEKGIKKIVEKLEKEDQNVRHLVQKPAARMGRTPVKTST